MNTMLAAMLGGWEIVLILAVVLILFGAKKLPELAKGLGQGIKEFKKATKDVRSDLENAMNDDADQYAPPPARRIESPPAKAPETAESAHAATGEPKA